MKLRAAPPACAATTVMLTTLPSAIHGKLTDWMLPVVSAVCEASSCALPTGCPPWRMKYAYVDRGANDVLKPVARKRRLESDVRNSAPGT